MNSFDHSAYKSPTRDHGDAGAESLKLFSRTGQMFYRVKKLDESHNSSSRATYAVCRT